MEPEKRQELIGKFAKSMLALPQYSEADRPKCVAKAEETLDLVGDTALLNISQENVITFVRLLLSKTGISEAQFELLKTEVVKRISWGSQAPDLSVGIAVYGEFIDVLFDNVKASSFILEKAYQSPRAGTCWDLFCILPIA